MGSLRDKHEQQLCDIMGANDWFMTLLRAARQCDLPQWYIGAGVIRSNPTRVSREVFKQRLRSKRLQDLWPALQVVLD